jgi:hypothetical protein
MALGRLKWRHLGIAAGAVCLLIIGGVAGAALHGDSFSFSSRNYAIDHQGAASTHSPVTTSSTRFESIGPLSRLAVSNHGPVSLTFTGDLSGGPVVVRAIGDRPLGSGPARFQPTGSHETFSATFVSRSMKRRCRNFGIEWKSPTGAPVTLRHGDFVLDYNFTRPHQICE